MHFRYLTLFSRSISKKYRFCETAAKFFFHLKYFFDFLYCFISFTYIQIYHQFYWLSLNGDYCFFFHLERNKYLLLFQRFPRSHKFAAVISSCFFFIIFLGFFLRTRFFVTFEALGDRLDMLVRQRIERCREEITPVAISNFKSRRKRKEAFGSITVDQVEPLLRRAPSNNDVNTRHRWNVPEFFSNFQISWLQLDWSICEPFISFRGFSKYFLACQKWNS